jgi:hypothetical protein
VRFPRPTLHETFNTIKTQGYELEHHYGHGQQHLATVFALLTFLVDQAQELGCRLFQAARARFHSRPSLWGAAESALYGVLHSRLQDTVGGDCHGPCADGVGPRYLVGEPGGVRTAKPEGLEPYHLSVGCRPETELMLLKFFRAQGGSGDNLLRG